MSFGKKIKNTFKSPKIKKIVKKTLLVKAVFDLKTIFIKYNPKQALIM
jgi:hypothetical protein